MVKEKTGAIVACVFLCIAISFTFCAGLFLSILSNTFLNMDNYLSVIKDKKVISAIYDPAVEELQDVFDEHGIDADVEDYVDEDFIQMFLEDYIDIALYGEDPEDIFTKDEYEDFAMDMALLTGMSRSEAREAKNELIDSFIESANEMADGDLQDSFDQINEVRETLDAVAIVCYGISAVLAVICVLIYKNKFRPLRGVAIATTVSSITNLGIWYLFKTFFEENLLKDIDEDMPRELFTALGDRMFNRPITVSFIALIVSIIAIVVFSIFSAAYNHSLMASDEYDE